MRRPRISRPPPHQEANGDPTVARVTPTNFRRPIRFPLPNEYTSAGLARQPQRRASFAFDTIRWPHLTTLNPLSARGSPALPFKCCHNDPSAHDDFLGASDFRRSDGAPNRPSRRPRNRGPRNQGRSRARPTDNGSRDDPPSTTESSPAILPTVSDCVEIRDGTWMQSKRHHRAILFSLPNEYTSAGLARQPQRRASFAFDTIRWPHLTTLNPLSARGSPALPFKCRHNDPSAHDDSLGASDFQRSDGAPNRQSRRPRNRGPRNRGRSRARPTDNGSRDDPPSTTESSPATIPTVSEFGEICDGTWMESKRDRRPILFSLGKYKSAGLARRTERRASLAFQAGPLPFVWEIEDPGRGLFHGDHSEQTRRALSESPSASRTGKSLPARGGPNAGR